MLAEQWKSLDPRWQVHPRTANCLGRPILNDPWIVHFSGRLKPWLYRGPERVDRCFYDFVDRTAWRGARPAVGIGSLALRLYDSPLRRLIYPLEKRALAGLRHASRRRQSAAM